VNYTLTEKQRKGKDFARSVYIAEDINTGEPFTEKNLRVIRPGFGMHPKLYAGMLGKKANRDLKKGERMNPDYTQEA
jgi:pseudaminic acid synthase